MRERGPREATIIIISNQTNMHENIHTERGAHEGNHHLQVINNFLPRKTRRRRSIGSENNDIFFVKQSLRFKTSAICFRKSPLPSSLKCSRREPISEARRLFRCVNFVEVTVLTVDWPSDNDTVLVLRSTGAVAPGPPKYALASRVRGRPCTYSSMLNA